ncbi:hypothetical protein VNO77_01336 [Canavalia gladiata]|uniref:Uncharacterized protein n=1 Tax=Canavalia gladiata TaxID=3824 RepID=A0AAN9MXJ4_CANGL
MQWLPCGLSPSYVFFCLTIFDKLDPGVTLPRLKRQRIDSFGADKNRMSFIMEFAENLILKLMEDPKERDRRFREHVYRVKDRCDKTKEMWSYPMRPYGFWTFERHNSQLAWDAQISQVPGRRDPYDDVLQHYSAPPK